jgi:transposase-like protein
MVKLVETICPRCNGNGYIVVQNEDIDCPMCEEDFMHMGGKVTTHNGYVMLPIEQTRKNVEGGRESIARWSGETLPEKVKMDPEQEYGW